MASPITSISHPTTGGQTFRTLTEAALVLAQIEARIDEIDGVKPQKLTRRGGFYGVRPR